MTVYYAKIKFQKCTYQECDKQRQKLHKSLILCKKSTPEKQHAKISQHFSIDQQTKNKAQPDN